MMLAIVGCGLLQLIQNNNILTHQNSLLNTLETNKKILHPDYSDFIAYTTPIQVCQGISAAVKQDSQCTVYGK